MLRVPIAQWLIDASYNVVCAASGPEGLDLLKNPDIDLAVVDVRLPGRIDGIALVRQAKELNSRLRVVFISGKPPELDVSDLGLFLEKPFRAHDMLALVNRMIRNSD